MCFLLETRVPKTKPEHQTAKSSDYMLKSTVGVFFFFLFETLVRTTQLLFKRIFMLIEGRCTFFFP